MKMNKMTMMNVKFTVQKTIIWMTNAHAHEDEDEDHPVRCCDDHDKYDHDRNDHYDHAADDEDEDHPARNRLRRNK